MSRFVSRFLPRRTVLSLSAASLASGLASGVLWSGPGQAAVADPVREMHAAVARARAQAARAPLRALPELDALAARQVAHMMQQGRTTHYDAQGRDPAARAAQIGYPGEILGEILGETLAETPVKTPDDALRATEDDVKATIAAWLANPDTSAVLLNPAARHLGLALQTGGDRHWWSLLTAG